MWLGYFGTAPLFQKTSPYWCLRPPKAPSQQILAPSGDCWEPRVWSFRCRGGVFKRESRGRWRREAEEDQRGWWGGERLLDRGAEHRQDDLHNPSTHPWDCLGHYDMTNRTTRSSFSIWSCLGGTRDSRDLMVQTFQLIMDNAEKNQWLMIQTYSETISRCELVWKTQCDKKSTVAQNTSSFSEKTMLWNLQVMAELIYPSLFTTLTIRYMYHRNSFLAYNLRTLEVVMLWFPQIISITYIKSFQFHYPGIYLV